MEYVLFKEGMISYDSGDGSVADPDVAGLWRIIKSVSYTHLNHTLFFNKYEKEVGHVYEADLKTEEAMKCFNETMDFLRELEVM